jgi:hypothetical protein
MIKNVLKNRNGLELRGTQILPTNSANGYASLSIRIALHEMDVGSGP